VTANKPGARPPRGGLVYMPEAEFPGDVVIHETYKTARAEMIDRDMVVSRKFQDQQWKALRLGAHPDIIQFTRYFVAKMKKIGIPIYPHEIVRSPERQRQLVRDGFSRALPEKAPHVWGCAVDLVHSVKHWNLAPQQWELIGELGEELAKQRGIQIEWGGRWPPIKNKVGWDPAHWQLRGWKKYMSEFPFMPIGE